MPDYSKGKIYKICSDDPDITDVYIGSTVRTLEIRLSKHITATRRQYRIHKLFALYGVEKFHIELIEDYPCGSKKDLVMREQHYIDSLDCINERNAYTDKIEYRKSMADIKYEYDKMRRANNKEKIAAEKKQYAINNKEKVSQQQRNKYLRNQEKLKEKIVCDCGTICCSYSLNLHKKTKKHATLLEALQQQAQACP